MLAKPSVPNCEPYRCRKYRANGEEDERLELTRVVEDDAHQLNEYEE